MTASDWSRRDFLERAAAVSAAVAFSSGLDARSSGNAKVVKVSGPGVPGDVAGAVKRALQPLGGMGAFVNKGQKVLLKPNMGFATEPHVHATTSPQVVAAVAREVLACGPARVLIADHPMRHPEACLRRNGIQAACRGLDVSVVLPISDRFYVETGVPGGEHVKKVRVLRDALEADVHIALPVAKSHAAAGFTGGVKGHMGLILNRESFHSIYKLDQAIADLATVLPVGLSILDGLQVMAQGGPAGPGELVFANTIVAGTDILAVDGVGVTLAPLYRRRIEPGRIRHLKLSEKMGVGRLDVPPDRFVEIKLYNM